MVGFKDQICQVGGAILVHVEDPFGKSAKSTILNHIHTNTFHQGGSSDLVKALEDVLETVQIVLHGTDAQSEFNEL